MCNFKCMRRWVMRCEKIKGRSVDGVCRLDNEHTVRQVSLVILLKRDACVRPPVPNLGTDSNTSI